MYPTSTVVNVHGFAYRPKIVGEKSTIPDQLIGASTRTIIPHWNSRAELTKAVVEAALDLPPEHLLCFQYDTLLTLVGLQT